MKSTSIALGRLGWLLALGAAGFVGFADETRLSLPELTDILRTNLPALTAEELSDAAARGLIQQLQPRVRLLAPASPAATASTNLVGRASVFEGRYGYIYLPAFAPGSAAALRSAYADLAASNSIRGLVLDVRYASGDDLRAGCEAADVFVADERLLLDWGEGAFTSVAKTNAIALPLVLLANRETRGAAEAFATSLRNAELALVIGSKTAGEMGHFVDVPLQNGSRLRILRQSEDKAGVSAGGLEPDLVVTSTPEAERAWWRASAEGKAAGGIVSSTAAVSTPAGREASTNRRVMNEAELVRMHRRGDRNGGDSAVTQTPASALPSQAVSDPCLVRALDLLKGLSVLKTGQAK